MSAPKQDAKRLECAVFGGAFERAADCSQRRVSARKKSGAEATAGQTLREFSGRGPGGGISRPS